jgi:hypothetical protein
MEVQSVLINNYAEDYQDKSDPDLYDLYLEPYAFHEMFKDIYVNDSLAFDEVKKDWETNF